MVATDSTIVGRDADLAAVERFLDRVAGDGGALVVDGEAGIGKTTIWREALARAASRPFRVLVARPAEAEADFSYAALTDLVAAAYEEVDTELPLPQRVALDEALLGAESDGQADPRTTSMGFVGVLRALAAERPVVVAVDDVQWLDRASERALEFAVRRLPPRVSFLVVRRSRCQRRAARSHTGIRGRLGRTSHAGPLSAAALHHLIRNELGRRRPVRSSSGSSPPAAGTRSTRSRSREPSHVRQEKRNRDPLPIPDNLQELVRWPYARALRCGS